MENGWKQFRWMAAGKFVSDLGTYFDMVALNVYVYQLTKSGLATALFMATRLGGGFLTSFWAGLLADRVSRKRLMIAADLLRAVAISTLVLAPVDLHLYLLFFVALALGCGNALFDVALQSSIPVIVGNEMRVKANAVLASAGSIAMAVGCLTSGMSLTAFSYRFAFAFDTCTYLLSAANLFLLKVTTSEKSAAHSEEKPSFFKEVRAISGYVCTIPLLGMLLLIRLGDALGSASHNVGLPIFSGVLDPKAPGFYLGVIYSTWALGKLASSLVTARGRLGTLVRNAGEAELVFGIATVAMSGGFIALFWATNPVAVVALSIFSGVADGISEISFVSRLQSCPDELRGRIFGVASTALTVGFGIGMVACSPFFDRYYPAWIVTVFHGVPLLMAIAFLAASARRRESAVIASR